MNEEVGVNSDFELVPVEYDHEPAMLFRNHAYWTK
jgi:hypothetical protein